MLSLPLFICLFLNLTLDAGIGSRLLAGCTTGAMAVAVAQPTDVVKVRFQAQVSSGGNAKRYQGTLDAYRTIGREEGIRGLWKGEGWLDGGWHCSGSGLDLAWIQAQLGSVKLAAFKNVWIIRFNFGCVASVWVLASLKLKVLYVVFLWQGWAQTLPATP